MVTLAIVTIETSPFCPILMNRKALVVGINTYTYLTPLNAPAVDANAISDRLEQDGEFRVIRVPEAITQSDDGVKWTQVVGQFRGISKL